MIERERTYLVKYLPKDLKDHPREEMIDIYVPTSVPHPTLRIRKKGEHMVITKKVDVAGEGASVKRETTIELTKGEYAALASVQGKILSKIRYQYPWQGRVAEIDVFQKDLFGLVLADFEFNTAEELERFQMPEFCLAEVTNETKIAGGLLAGKSYSDMRMVLEKYGYKPLLY